MPDLSNWWWKCEKIDFGYSGIRKKISSYFHNDSRLSLNLEQQRQSFFEIQADHIVRRNIKHSFNLNLYPRGVNEHVL